MNWKIDPSASRVEFATQQMMGLIRGQFRHVEGSLVYEPDQPEDAAVTARIASASVSTGIGALDDHLRGPDMLDAASYPELAFESRTVNAAGDHYRIEGDLRIWDETRPIVVEARIADQAASEPVQPGEPAASGASGASGASHEPGPSGERVSFHGTTRLRGLFADETLDLTIQLTAVQENGAGTRRESAAS